MKIFILLILISTAAFGNSLSCDQFNTILSGVNDENTPQSLLVAQVDFITSDNATEIRAEMARQCSESLSTENCSAVVEFASVAPGEIEATLRVGGDVEQ